MMLELRIIDGLSLDLRISFTIDHIFDSDQVRFLTSQGYDVIVSVGIMARCDILLKNAIFIRPRYLWICSYIFLHNLHIF